MGRVQTLVTWDTQLSADSVEWCPFPSKSQLLVCGTYQLVEGEQQATTRRGRLHLLAYTDTGQQGVSLLHSVEMPAVLDCKWAPTALGGKELLGVVNAAGELSLFRLSRGSECLRDELVEDEKIKLPAADGGGDVLALALDWSPKLQNLQCGDVRIAVSDSRGRVTTFRLDDGGLCVEHCWTAHQFEAWTVHVDRFSPNICYTGGDDAKLRVYDLRSDLQSAKLTSTQHSAGVTSFAQSNVEHQLLSGSYDELVIRWDTRQMKRPVDSAQTGGGVWRLRYRPGAEDCVLAACMYNGFHIFDRDLTAVAHYQEHSSIAYGAHWNEQTPFVMATCSFYDHKLNISTLIK